MSHQDHIGELLKMAGHRHMPDPDQMARARTAARAEWEHLVQHRPWRFSTIAFGTAALVALTVAVATWFAIERPVNAPAAPAEIATVQKVIGTLLLTRAGSQSRAITESGGLVRAGDRLETAAGSRVVLVMTGGALAKLDEQSRIALDDTGALTLSRGAVFVDAAPGNDARHLQVRTPLGVVQHVGTQFEVRLQDDGMRVRVREGTIAFERAGNRWLSSAGESLLIRTGGEPTRQPIATYGSEWGWLDELIPPFTLEGSTLGAFLQWVGREHGLRWEYGDPAMGQRVERIVLHGSIEGLTAEEALQAVLPTCGLSFRRTGDLIVISKRE